MSVLPVGIGSSGGYTISRSVRTRSSASAYFNRTPAGASNRTTWTWSGWVKRGSLSSDMTLFQGYSNANNYTSIILESADRIQIQNRVAGTATFNWVTTPVYRDPSAWYHIVVIFNTTQATSTNRIALYVNGVQITTFSTQTTGAQNATGFVNNNNSHNIGRSGAATQYFDGYLTEINFIDGQALTPSSFGETDAITGVWKPKKYTGTYGTNGFYLNFSDNSAATATTIGKDYSGNGNNWTPNNISVTAGVTYDSMLDVPTQWADGGNGRGNYAVLNPVAPNPSTTASTCADGNLTASASAANTMRKATIGITSGAYYFEATLGSTVQGFGLGEAAVNSFGTNSASTGARTYYLYNGGANLYTILPSADTSITTTVGSGGTLAVAVDMTNKKLWLGYAASGGGNITWIGGGSPSAGTSPTHTFASDVSEVFPLALTNGPALYCNFGQRPFSYTPPTGFVALNTQNLPTPTISNGANYMNASTYTGNGATQSISNAVNGVSFQPDLVWVKSRSNAYHGALVDNVRGVDKYLYSSLTIAEETQTTALSSFNSNGFSLAGSFGNVNANGTTYVGWQWKAGGTAVSNTAGTITSSVSANPTAGFSVVTYTGTGANATVGHGLGVAPKMMIVKQRSASGNYFVVWMSGVTSTTQSLWLGATNAILSTPNYWNSTAPTSSVFSVGNDSATNGSGSTYVAYLFAEVAGYSKFGKYTGNGSADGPFVYCGFRPRFVMMKRTDSTGNWFIDDSSRSGYNVITSDLLAEATNVEASYNGGIDFLSNGFKQKATANGNASGGTYIFMAFAENPFKHSLAR